jgi:hypothetical protein
VPRGEPIVKSGEGAMKCVETYKTREAATEKRRLLEAAGIEAHVVVDPLEARFPALSHFQDVALMVPEASMARAETILRNALKNAS